MKRGWASLLLSYNFTQQENCRKRQRGTRDTITTAAIAKSSLLNSKAAEFIPSTFVDKTSSTPRTCNDLEAPKEISHGVSEGQSLQLVERTFQSILELQQKQNETIIATHQQLTAAMTLRQPTITKFKGDPIEYVEICRGLRCPYPVQSNHQHRFALFISAS